MGLNTAMSNFHKPKTPTKPTLPTRMRRVTNSPQLTMPSVQQQPARRDSHCRAGEVLPDQTMNRLSAIMEAEPPKSMEKTVTMSLSEIPPPLLSPSAQVMAKESPDRLVTFNVSLHPILETVGMSTAQAIHNGVAMPVDKPITPHTIAQYEQRHPRVGAATPFIEPQRRGFSRGTYGEELAGESTDASGEVSQEDSCRSSKTVHFSDQDDVFQLSPVRSPRSLEEYGACFSTPRGQAECPEATVQKTESSCMLRQAPAVQLQESRNEVMLDAPSLPVFDFGRKSGEFGSLFHQVQADPRTVVGDIPGLPGLRQRLHSPDKGKADAPKIESDGKDSDDEIDIHEFLDSLMRHSECVRATRRWANSEPAVVRSGSPTLGIGEQDVVMKSLPATSGARVLLRKLPALSGPPPSTPLPPLPPGSTITGKTEPAAPVKRLDCQLDGRRQRSREINQSALVLPSIPKQSDLKEPSRPPEAAPCLFSGTVPSSPKIHAHQLLQFSRASHAPPTLRAVLTPSSPLNFSEISHPCHHQQSDQGEGSPSFPTPLLSSEGPVYAFPDCNSSGSDFEPDKDIVKFPIYQQSLEDLRTKRLRLEKETAELQSHPQQTSIRALFPSHIDHKNLVPAPLKLASKIRWPFTPGSGPSSGKLDKKSRTIVQRAFCNFIPRGSRVA